MIQQLFGKLQFNFNKQLIPFKLSKHFNSMSEKSLRNRRNNDS